MLVRLNQLYLILPTCYDVVPLFMGILRRIHLHLNFFNYSMDSINDFCMRMKRFCGCGVRASVHCIGMAQHVQTGQ